MPKPFSSRWKLDAAPVESLLCALAAGRYRDQAGAYTGDESHHLGDIMLLCAFDTPCLVLLLVSNVQDSTGRRDLPHCCEGQTTLWKSEPSLLALRCVDSSLINILVCVGRDFEVSLRNHI